MNNSVFLCIVCDVITREINSLFIERSNIHWIPNDGHYHRKQKEKRESYTIGNIILTAPLKLKEDRY